MDIDLANFERAIGVSGYAPPAQDSQVSSRKYVKRSTARRVPGHGDGVMVGSRAMPELPQREACASRERPAALEGAAELGSLVSRRWRAGLRNLVGLRPCSMGEGEAREVQGFTPF